MGKGNEAVEIVIYSTNDVGDHATRDEMSTGTMGVLFQHMSHHITHSKSSMKYWKFCIASI